MNRRQFLQALAATSTAPLWVRFAESAVASPGAGVVRSTGGGRLLVVFLQGGNDPLNTVAPYLDSTYRALRPSIALSEREVFALGNGLGLHRGLPSLFSRWQAGQLAVIQQVGAPRNDFSHFTATETWETASPDRAWSEGWLGRYLDRTTARAAGPLRAVALTDVMPTTLESRSTNAVALRSIVDYAFSDREASDAQLRHGTFRSFAQASAPAGSMRQAVISGQRELVQTLDPVAATNHRYNAKASSPPGAARTVAQLFAAGVGTEVGFLALHGFDNHTNLRRHHDLQLGRLDAVVQEFFASAQELGVLANSAVLVVSEFGRRAPQNSSGGTDHGDGGLALLAGPRVRGGLYGPTPDLRRLRDGNLPVEIDLRKVYASVLDQFLGTDPSPILGGRFIPLPLFR